MLVIQPRLIPRAAHITLAWRAGSAPVCRRFPGASSRAIHAARSKKECMDPAQRHAIKPNIRSEWEPFDIEPRLGLLRSLLRETTYLPDPASRIYLRSYILDRYRAQVHGVAFHERLSTWHTAGPAAEHSRGKQEHQHGSYQHGSYSMDEKLFSFWSNSPWYFKLQHEAEKSLRALQRANDCHPKELLKTLLMTYGRTGRRRFRLMQPLLRPDPPNASHTDPLRERLPKLRPRHRARLPRLSNMLVALLRSQQKTHIDADAPHSGSQMKKIELEVPAENSWKRPIPQVRVVNMVKAHHAKLLDRALPPVSSAEWEELRTLASPDTTEEEFRVKGVRLHKKRRPMAESSDNAVRRSTHLELALNARGKRKRRRHRGRYTGGYRGKPRPAKGKDQPHNLTKRGMRRFYQLVYSMTPKMEWQSEKQQWSVQWGRTKRKQRAELVGVLDSILQEDDE